MPFSRLRAQVSLFILSSSKEFVIDLFGSGVFTVLHQASFFFLKLISSKMSFRMLKTIRSIGVRTKII